MKARIPKHREFIINFPDSIDQNKANEGWAKLQQLSLIHISEPTRRTPISYAVFCLKKKKKKKHKHQNA